MKYKIELAPDARSQFHALSGYDRGKIRFAIDRYLATDPTQESKSRIKRLRELKRPNIACGLMICASSTTLNNRRLAFSELQKKPIAAKSGCISSKRLLISQLYQRYS